MCSSDLNGNGIYISQALDVTNSIPAPKFGSGNLYSDGNSYISITTNISNQAQFSLKTDFTIEAFVNLKAYPTLGNMTRLFGSGEYFYFGIDANGLLHAVATAFDSNGATVNIDKAFGVSSLKIGLGVSGVLALSGALVALFFSKK